MEFGKAIKEKMVEKQVNQAALAEAIGMPKTTLSGLLSRDTSKISIDVFLKICKYLECDPEELYDEFEKRDVSKAESLLIQKYNSLDKHGRQVVDAVLAIEVERCAEEEKQIQIRHSFYKVSAGLGYDLDDSESWEMISVPDTPEAERADFALTIQGDSMEPVYFDGDIVLVKQQEQINQGEVGIFIVNGEGYIKKLGRNRLISLNAVYEDIVFNENDHICCAGKVIGRV